MDSPSPPSSQPLLSSSPSLLPLILLLSLPSLSLSPPSLAALSLTNKEVRSVVFGELFRELKVERALEEGEEGELDDGEELSEVRGAVRRLEWVVKGSEVCGDEDNEEEDEEGSLEEWKKKGEKEVVGKLGTLISSLPSLTSLSLTSSSFHRSTSTPLSLAPLLLPSPSSLTNLSSLSLTGFSIPNDLLLDLLVSTPNLLELTLQTFSPPSASSSSVFPVLGGLIELTSSSPTPSPLPPTLPSSALKNLHTFTGLASHVRTLLPPGGGQRSLRSLTVELCGGAGGWEKLVPDLADGLPCREGLSGLVELRILGIEGTAGVEEGVRLVRKLGEALKGKGGLEELELGWGEGLGEVGGEVEDFLTKSLPHLSSSSSFSSLRSLSLTTPEPTSPSPPPTSSPTPTPLLPLSLALPDLSTLTINSTLWRFFRPPPPPFSDPNALVRVPTNTTTTTRPALTSSASASGSHALGVGLNNNKKAARRLRVAGCGGEREGEGGLSSEGED